MPADTPTSATPDPRNPPNVSDTATPVFGPVPDPATNGTLRPSGGSATPWLELPPKTFPGQLKDAVLAYLIHLGGQDATITQVHHVTGKSGGAIEVSVGSLVKDGLVVQTGDKPRRYRAAQGATPPTPRPAPTPRPPRRTTTPATTPTNTTQPAQSEPPQAPPPTPPTPPAAKPPVPSPNAPVTGPIVRPNGQAYHPRTLAGLPDVTALRKLRAANVPVLLYGPPGTGKTSVLEAAFPDLVTVAGDGNTSVSDLIGSYTQAPDGSYVWIEGPLVRAMTEGRALLIDDATLIDPKVLASLYPAMDGRRQIIVKEHLGEAVTAADGFYVVAGHNPGVHGAILTEALSSRFSIQVKVTSDYDLARALKIPDKAVKIARQCATQQANGVIGWAPQLRELIAYLKIRDALSEEVALANLIGIAPEEDREIVTEIVKNVAGRTIDPLALGAQIRL